MAEILTPTPAGEYRPNRNPLRKIGWRLKKWFLAEPEGPTTYGISKQTANGALEGFMKQINPQNQDNKNS